MVARQLKSVSQIDAFTISTTMNTQYVFKKRACLTVFLKDIVTTERSCRGAVSLSVRMTPPKRNQTNKQQQILSTGRYLIIKWHVRINFPFSFLALSLINNR